MKHLKQFLYIEIEKGKKTKPFWSSGKAVLTIYYHFAELTGVI